MIEIALLAIALLVITLTLGVPLPYCFGSALMVMYFLGDVTMKGMMLWGVQQLGNPVLLAIPLFVLAGTVMSESGIAASLLRFVNAFIGHVRGGLGVVAAVSCAVIGAISGSGLTGIAAIGPLLIPEMEKRGYPREYATALIANSSILGLLIPPSVTMIVYGWVTDTSILACFLATLGPGLLIMTSENLASLVVLGEDLALVHGKRSENLTIQALDLKLRSLGQLVLLLDESVDAGKIALNLGAVAVLRDLATLSHLLNVVLQLTAAGTGDFLVVEVTSGIDGGSGASGDSDILVDRSDVKNFLDVLNELLSKLLGKLVSLASLGGAVVDVVLHEFEELGVGTVHKANALADDLTVDSLEATEDDVEVHVEGILTSPVPRGVVGSGLEGSEDRLDTGSIEVTVLGSPEIKLSLQNLLGLLGVDVSLLALTEVDLEVTSKELELLLEESTLVLGKGIDGSGVHHHTTAGTASRASRSSCGQTDTSVCGVLVGNTVEEALGVTLVAQSSGRLHCEGEEQSTVLSTRSETPSRLEVFSGRCDVETTRHLGGDKSGNQGQRLLAQVAIESGLHGGTELIEGCVFGLLRGGTEFLS